MSKPEEFDWVQLKATIDETYAAKSETARQKFKRKFNENPLIPVGCLATSAALVYGLYCFRKGDAKKSQLMMRLRIAAQGFTVVALVGGIFIAAVKPNTNKS